MKDSVGQPLFVNSASSNAPDAVDALRECLSQIDLADCRFVLFFVPNTFDRNALSAELGAALNGVPAFGCTTAGQITGEGYETDSLLVMGFPKAHFRCASILLDRISGRSVGDFAEITKKHAERFRHTHGWNRLALLFTDGMSNQEDILASTLDTVLEGLPIFGGSAADGLNFGATYVLHDGRFHEDTAVLLMLETDLEFQSLNFDHFLPTDLRLVITRADPEKRLVYEINGAPAAQEYARLIGCPVDRLCPQVFAENPMLILYKHNHYVRAVRDVVAEDALSFMAAIDDGLIMTLGQGQERIETLRRGLDRQNPAGQTPDFILGFDCILRKLEFEEKQLLGPVSAVLRDHRVLGFSTYGEQHAGVHMNQTFVGIAFFEPRAGEMF